ncbi:MAG: SRPBCC domain-containing protein [Deltaproteobacteria bacterium]|nr:SRPBCC domain-containing protein [Deltaproteobacteria bacterium]
MDELDLSEIFATDPQTLFNAWLDGAIHGAMTGAPATGTATVGGQWTAWDGYSSGENLEIEPYSRIVQSWRTTDFPVDAGPSQIVVTFTQLHDGQTVLRIVQTALPAGTGASYSDGWKKFYFAPMHKYFRRAVASAAYGEPTKKKAPKKKAVKAKAKPKKTAAKAKPKKVAAKKKPKKKARRSK